MHNIYVEIESSRSWAETNTLSLSFMYHPCCRAKGKGFSYRSGVFPNILETVEGENHGGCRDGRRDRRMVTLSYSIGRSSFRDGSRETRIVSSRSRGHELLYAIVTLERILRISCVCTYLTKDRPIPVVTFSRRKIERVFSHLYKNLCPKKTNKLKKIYISKS